MNFKIIKKFYRAILFLIVVWFVSCDNNKKVNYDTDTSVEGKLIIPQRIVMYQPFPSSNSIVDSVKIANSSLKIYSLVDGSCATCVGSIKKWINFTKMTNIPVILMITSSDEQFNLFKYVCEEGEFKNFKYPFFLDLNNEFYSLNRELFADKGIHTVLADADNKILLFGNPTESSTIQKDYLEKIKLFESN